jgi:hypothetical protein
MTPEQEEARGEDARTVLNNLIYKEAYSQIEANIVRQMASASTTPEQGEDYRKLLIALRKVRNYMEQVLATGTMVAMQEERKRTWAETIKARYTGMYER